MEKRNVIALEIGGGAQTYASAINVFAAWERVIIPYYEGDRYTIS